MPTPSGVTPPVLPELPHCPRCLVAPVRCDNPNPRTRESMVKCPVCLQKIAAPTRERADKKWLEWAKEVRV